jgi:hypothetical protein
MEQSPSWEANRIAASLEIPRNLWNPKVDYRSHKLKLRGSIPLCMVKYINIYYRQNTTIKLSNDYH